ncbi:MAG: GNAT family N-acetyltransferase [Deltaproteobacteria bacterium]|nr:GNAT family N-acetyltransferase [Deltaproteobacteria bacterium]MBW2416634.1 GNAT family N-acetyltransferase [Deltaproteobacteria bacterium]
MADLELLEGVQEVPRDEWNALVGGESPFLEWEWLASLEEAGVVGDGTGWGARPLVARQDGRVVAACPLYVKGNSEGEFVFDWNWADAAYRSDVDYYPKLLVGVPFTPVTGARFLVAPGLDRADWIRRLATGLREICKQNELSSVHVNFCLEDEIEPLRDAGFDLRVGIQYHWINHGYESFDDYLGAFRSKRRNQIRRERRALETQGVRIEARVGDEIPEEQFRTMFGFYTDTIDKKFYGRQYLNERFFDLVRQRFRDRLCFIVASQGDHPVGGTFNVQKGDALYGRYWGATRDVRYLHFNVCYYAAVEHAIQSGLQRFEPGAGGDYKQMRGFDAQPTWSLHYIADERFREAVAGFLVRERAQAASNIEWIREHSALKGVDFG